MQPFAGLHPSTTRPILTLNANLSGRGPSILLRKTVRSLKSPTGAFIAPLRCANANLSGRGSSILLTARPFGRLKAPLGLSLLRFAAQTRTTLFLLCTKSCIVWRKIGVWCSFCWKFAKRKSLKLLGTSRSFRLFLLKLEIYCSIGFIVGNSSTSRMEALSVSSITRRSTPKPRPPVGGRPYSSALT